MYSCLPTKLTVPDVRVLPMESWEPIYRVFVTPSDASAVNEVFFYFHGAGSNHEPSALCTGDYKICDTVSTQNNIAVVLFNRANSDHNDWFEETSDTGVQCVISEAKDILSRIGVPSDARYSLAGHSAGGKPVSEFAKKSDYSYARSLFFDACYSN
jgi:hypothetical protein